MAAPLSLVALGDLVYDVLVHSDEEQLSLESDITAHIRIQPGGSAANYAVWAARLLGGAGAVSFISKVGTDEVGQTLVQSLEAEGVQPSVAVDEGGRSSGTVLVFVNRSGRRTMVTDPGASRALTVADIAARADLLAAASAFHLTSYSIFTDPPRPAALYAAQLAKAGGALLSLDPSSDHLLDLLGGEQYDALARSVGADIFLPNLAEGRFLSGLDEPTAIARAMHRYAPIVALKLEAEGCIVSRQGGEWQHLPASPASVVDTTGAGDSFAAAFVVNYLQTGDVVEAARAGNALAAQVVARLGAR